MISLSSSPRSDIECRVRRAIEKLWEHDRHLLTTDVNERSITHHLANHLQQEFQNWNVDVEYNRDDRNVKRLSIPTELSSEAAKNNVSRKDTNAVTVYPDIIVHRRGDNDYNLLVVEVKKRGCGHGQDERKLAAFTTPLPEDGLGYRWGLHLILESKEQGKASLCWYKQGKPCDEQMVEEAF